MDAVRTVEGEVVRSDYATAHGRTKRLAQALERLYRDGSKWTALVDLLKEELDRIAPDANEARIAKLLEIAELYRDRLKLDTMALATSSETRFITLMRGLIAGPAVSLKGSPTVSPMTAASCPGEPLPPWWPSSMYFLALSQAPPPVHIEIATNRPVKIGRAHV